MRLISICSTLTLLVLPKLCSSQPGADIATRIDQVVRVRSTAGDFNGSVLVVRRGRIIYERGFGFANLEWSIPNDGNTKFEIGSMTKQFTALLVLQFVNQDKIRLQGHLSDYLFYYRKDTGSRVTINQLLSHTSGIPSFTGSPSFLNGTASRAHHPGKGVCRRLLQRGLTV